MTTLSNPGDRNDKVTIERAQALIEKWDAELKQIDGDDLMVTMLDLQCRVYLVPAAELICQYLKDRVVHVKTAKLNDIIASLPTDEGLKVLSLLTELLSKSPLEELNLDDNAMGIRGVQVCANILSCPTLRTLSLQNDGLSEESMTHLRKALVHPNASTSTDGTSAATSGSPVCHLKELHLYNNMIGSKGAKETGKILAACYQLQIFRYEGCRPGPEGTMGLVSGLLEMTKMKHNLTTTTATACPLESCPLESLSLEGSLGSSQDEPVGTFCEALANLPHLKRLRLYDVGLESNGTKLVMKSLSSLYQHQKTNVIDAVNHTSLFQLERLELNQNEMDASAMIALSDVIQQHLYSLKILQLESNEITSIGVERLMKIFKKEKGNKQTNNHVVALEELCLSENMIGSRGARALIDAKHNNLMPKLKVLTLNDNGIPEDLVDELQACYGAILKELTDNNDEDDCDDDLDEDDEEDNDEENDDEEEDDGIDDLTRSTNMVKLSPEDVSL